MSNSDPKLDNGAANLLPLTPEAQRALAEAEARRKARETASESKPEEIGGRGGLDPARYGDWEKDGIASDF